MTKFVKVMYGATSGAKSDFKYKINEVNIANNWNPTAESGKDFGGFNYATEDCILRWLHRGDTIYDVKVPDDAENIKLDGATTIYRTNKIIISNPRKIDNELALHFYEISNIPEKSYYKALAVVAIMGYKKTAYAILKDKVNKNNIDEVLEEWNDFISHKGKDDRKDIIGLVSEIDEILKEIKSELLISINVDKEPYIKKITDDKVINVTGESGSGKSYFSNQYLTDENYIVIDTDIVFSNRLSDNKESVELREVFKDKPKDYLFTDFDDFYLKTLEYFKNSKKTIVIDSAQYRNMNDISFLKGKIIVMRTCVDTCYNRCVNRWKEEKSDKYLPEELDKYATKKLSMYNWYKTLNKFLENVESLQKTK